MDRAAWAAGRVHQPVSQGDDRSGQDSGNLRRDKSHAEDSKQCNGGVSGIFVGMDGPAAADGRKCRNRSKGHRHAGEHRQTAFDERLPCAGKDKGKNRENARTEDCQRTSEIGNDKKRHHRVL